MCCQLVRSVLQANKENMLQLKTTFVLLVYKLTLEADI